MTKRHVQHNGVWIYEVTLDPETTPPTVIPVLGPDQMGAWLKAITARMGEPMPIPESQRLGE